MIIKDFVKQYCTERGMFDNQADAVVEMVINSPENEVMKDRWEDEIEGYPPSIKMLTMVNTKTQAIKYIEENCPEAWFKPMFL